MKSNLFNFTLLPEPHFQQLKPRRWYSGLQGRVICETWWRKKTSANWGIFGSENHWAFANELFLNLRITQLARHKVPLIAICYVVNLLGATIHQPKVLNSHDKSNFKDSADKIKENTLMYYCTILNTLKPKQNGTQFAGDTFVCSFLTESIRILIQIWFYFVPEVQFTICRHW